MPRGGKRPGAGRPKGVPNKLTTELKDMILQALANKGGVSYLEQQAEQSPTAFLTLVGKVLPLQVTGAHGAPLIPPGTAFTVQITQIPGSENRT